VVHEQQPRWACAGTLCRSGYASRRNTVMSAMESHRSPPGTSSGTMVNSLCISSLTLMCGKHHTGTSVSTSRSTTACLDSRRRSVSYFSPSYHHDVMNSGTCTSVKSCQYPPSTKRMTGVAWVVEHGGATTRSASRVTVTTFTTDMFLHIGLMLRRLGFHGWGGDEKNGGSWLEKNMEGEGTCSRVGVRCPMALVGKFVKRGMSSGSFTKNKLK
jgi:hypothetical protein